MTEICGTMADLYSYLATQGINKKFLQQKILPDWWTDEVDQTPGTFTEGLIYIARRLNMDATSLINPGSEIRFLTLAQPKFKAPNHVQVSRLTIPLALTARIAELVAHACKSPVQEVTRWTALEIRSNIFQRQDYVNLGGFLNFCWSQGIPVIHFCQFPPNSHKFHGMVAKFFDRPVIVVSLKQKSLARLLFIAAHELGHIVNRHLPDQGVLVDEEIQLESDDREENEANEFATALLLGNPGLSFDIRRKFLNVEDLSQSAMTWGQANKVDPGVVSFNVAWNRAHRARTESERRIAWATGTKAAQMIEGEVDGIAMINRRLMEELDWSLLSQDDQDYLATMLDVSRI